MNTAYFIVLAVLMIFLMIGHSNLIILSAGLFVTVSLLCFIMPTRNHMAPLQPLLYAGAAQGFLGSMHFVAGTVIPGISRALVLLGVTGLLLVELGRLVRREKMGLVLMFL